MSAPCQWFTSYATYAPSFLKSSHLRPLAFLMSLNLLKVHPVWILSGFKREMPKWLPSM